MQSTAMPDPQSDIRICFFGDSFVTGTGDPAYLGWTGRVCAALKTPVTYYNLGIRGNTSGQISDRWQTEATARLPRHGGDLHLVFSFGTNDASMEAGTVRIEPNRSVAIAHDLLNQALAQAPQRVLFIGPPPIAEAETNQRIAKLSASYATLCASLNIPYLDVFTSLSQTAPWMSEVALIDGAHPAAAGYAALAALVSQWSAWQAWFPS
jgi:acyl-CoA thioesterase I